MGAAIAIANRIESADVELGARNAHRAIARADLLDTPKWPLL